MTTRLILICFVSVFLVSGRAIAQNVNVQIHNKTGQNIDSLIINGKYIGYLADGHNTGTLVFENFTLDSGHPIGAIVSLINDRPVSSRQIYRCGASMEHLREGNFVFELVLTEEHPPVLELRNPSN